MKGDIRDIFQGPDYELRPGIFLKPVYCSKTLMSVLFIVNNNIPSHRHPNIQFGLVLGGEGVLGIGGDELKISENSFYYIPSNIEHYLKVTEKPLYAIDFFIPPREDYMKFFK